MGEPREVYLRPRTRFVADFIGEANIIDLTLEGSDVVLSGWGVIPAEAWASDSPAAGADGHVAAVRPEDVLLSADGPGRFTIMDATFIGGDLHAVIQVGDTTVSARQPAAHASGLSTGGTCDVAFRPGSLRIVEG